MCHFLSLDSDFKSSMQNLVSIIENSKLYADILNECKRISLLVKFLFNTSNLINVPESLKLSVNRVHGLFAGVQFANNL